MGTQALLVRLGNSEPVAKAGKRRGKRNDAPKMLNRFGMVDFLSPPLNGFMFGATPSPWFDTDQAVGPALGDLQSDQVEYFSSWSQWVGFAPNSSNLGQKWSE